MWSIDEEPHKLRTRKFIAVEDYFPVHQVLQGVSARPRHAFACGLSSFAVAILRPIAIYIMNRCWRTMRSLYLPLEQRAPFTSGHLHELYTLLAERFAFTDPERKATIDALRHISAPTHADEPEAARKHLQQRWLTAIIGKGAAEADDWMAKLSADPTLGPRASHPDFTSYMSSWKGPGASPYTVEELVGFCGRRGP